MSLAAKDFEAYEIWRLGVLSRWYNMRKAKLNVPCLKEGPTGKLTYLIDGGEALVYSHWVPIEYEDLVKVLDTAERKPPQREEGERNNDATGPRRKRFGGHS